MSHTPGPWTNQVARTSCGVVFKIGPFPWRKGTYNHACIYADYPSSVEHQECSDNARLIAAAPDLLDACQACLFRDDIADDELGDVLRAAIAKATGK